MKTLMIMCALWAGLLGFGGLAAGGGIGDGTLPFSGHALLAPGQSVRLELRAAATERAILPCAGESVAIMGHLQLNGASYPIEAACVLPSREVRLEAASSAEPIELVGRFDANGFAATMRWGEHEGGVFFASGL